MKYKLLFVSVLLAIHQVHAAEFELPASLGGDINVDTLGILGYSIPIEIPPSINGYIPQLSISYNGQSPDGILGLGWNVSGFSSITRCNELKDGKLFTPALSSIEEKSSAVSFSNSCFSLNGQKLIRVSPDNVEIAKTEFRLENDSFTKITIEFESAVNSVIKKFIVKHKNGVTQEFSAAIKGNRRDSSGTYQENTTTPVIYEWGLTSVIDNNKNYWTVEYQDLLKGMLYPKIIKYTGNNSEKPIVPNNSIEFEYLDRNGNEKKNGFIEDGATRLLDKKLVKINIKSNNVLRREYNFQYDPIADNAASTTRLKSIYYCTFDGSDKLCVVPTKIEWNSYGKGVMMTPIRDMPEKLLNSSLRTLRISTKKNLTTKETVYVNRKDSTLNLYSTYVDLDGTRLSTTISHPSILGYYKWSITTADINNDGLEDLVIYGKGDVGKTSSLLFFTSSFDDSGMRKFDFYKELKDIPAPLDYLWGVKSIDGDNDGIRDLVLVSTSTTAPPRFDGIKLDALGNIVSIKSTTFSTQLNNNIVDGFQVSNPSEYVGNFKRDGSNDVLKVGGLNLDLYLCTYSIYNKVILENKTINSCDTKQRIPAPPANTLKNSFFAYRKIVVDYNKDGLDDVLLFNVIYLGPVDGSSPRRAKFQVSLVPLLSKGSLTGDIFEMQKEVVLEPFEIETDYIPQPEGAGIVATFYFSSPVFADFNYDGYLDFFMYAGKPTRPYLLSFLQKPDQKYDLFLKDMRDFYKPRSSMEELVYSANGFPSSEAALSNYDLNIMPFLSDINNDGFSEINLQFMAKAQTGSEAFIYSYFSQAVEKDVWDLGRVWVSLKMGGFKNSQNMLKSIETGDGRKQQFRYTNFSQSSESIEARLFPIRPNSSAFLVTSAVENYLNNVLGSTSSYLYASPRVDVKEKRFLGFETTTETTQSYNKTEGGIDVTNKFVKETIYNQNYPYIGMPKSVVIKANDALVSKVTVADTDFVSDSAYPTTKVKFPRIKKSTVENYDLGKLISTTVTNDSYENVFGNLTSSNVTTTSADNTTTFSTQVNPTYYASDTTNWIPGLVKERLVTSARTGQPSIQKKTIFEYDAKQHLSKKIDEPDDAVLKLQTEYGYDNYGNVNKVTVTGNGDGADTNIGSRVVNSFYEAGTDYPAGVFKTKVTNALSQQSTSSYDAITGQMLSSTDINGVINTQTVDSIGRVKTSSPAGSAQTTMDYQLCKTFVSVGTNTRECETGENYKITSTTTLNAPVVTFKDATGNVKRTVTKAYDDTNDLVVRNEYDPAGRLYRSSVPSLSNVAYANLQWLTYEYDVLGRMTKLTEPGNRVTAYTYDGLQSTMTNAKGLKRTEKTNMANEVIEVLDNDNNSLKYTRDALGRVTKTTDALGNSITLTLDNNGNKVQQVDPDLGILKYRYNPLGQVVWQQDAKGQQTTFQYDVLGRLKQRVEPDLTSTWTWDTASNGKGKLVQVSSANGFSESYAYDSFGRLYQTTTSKTIDPLAQSAADSDYITKWNYDAAGRTLAFAYPTGFGYRNIYDTNGYLKEVRNLAGTQLYWTANTRDARGNVTRETLGNGLITDRAYKADTGFLETINTGNATIQQNSYAFDAIGNLTNRNQNLAGISINETFTYDNINRLKSVVNQQGATTSVNYNEIGNITSKSDTGTYNYTTGGTNCGVHKVCAISSTTGGLNTAFSYDVDGNLLTGNNRTSTWTSFDMPLQIKQGTTTESFMYNADHERVRRTSVENGQTTTTVYLNPRIDTGGTFEKTYLPNGTTEYTHYLYAGGDVIGSYVGNDKGTPPTVDLGTAYQTGVAPNSAVAATIKTGPYRYFHTDHLNSTEVITDSAGNAIERLSYDPWGKRRNLDGTASATAIKGTKNSHGFTSHEMLDSIGLVHMNGRVYDPQVGRFISADPTIDGEGNLQGYNRYSYVYNNPGTLLDPSGYSWLSKTFNKIGRELNSAFLNVADDWLGSCSRAAGTCSVNIGTTATYGLNNSGSGLNDGRLTVQPFIGFGGTNYNFTLGLSYNNKGLSFNNLGYQEGAFNIQNYRTIVDAKVFDSVTGHIFSAAGTELIEFFDTMGKNKLKEVDESFPSKAEIVVDASLTAAGAGRVPRLGFGKLGAAAEKLWNLLFKRCGCFDDDTPVLTKDGYKRIVEIKEGDLVLARHEETGEIAYKPVKRVFVVPNRRIYLLKTINSIGKENTIEVSDDHPFWVVEKKWIHSIDLKEGDQLLDANNQVHKVVSLTETDRVETTYNLEVEGYHTYFAGDANIWVHNADCLSSLNPVGRAISKAYDDILLGNGVRRPTTFVGRAPHEKPWAGSIEYEVPGAANPNVTRILQKPNGQMGITFDHYKTIIPFPSPWFKDGGTREAYNKAIKNGIK